jgi:hypothetical protein
MGGIAVKRFASLSAGVGAIAVVWAFGLSGGASGASSLPTLNIALSGANGISVSGDPAYGAINVVATFSGKLPKGSQGAAVGLVRLRPGVTIQQAVEAVNSHHGNLNALTPYGALFVAAAAPSTLQTVLLPGYSYVALNITGNGQPAVAPFTVANSPSPAALPAAKATETAIDFGFRGPKVLHDGTLVRGQNHGWLVHMITLNGARSKRAAIKAMTLMRHGAGFKRLRPYLTRNFAAPLLEASPGAIQQQVLNTKPGWYVEACFMDTQDRREHIQLGMLRLVHVVK